MRAQVGLPSMHRGLWSGLLLSVWTVLGGWGVPGAVPPTRPNILFILADDLGYGELGCYGQQLIRTPALEQMAREGMRFTQFYAGATVCAPSRSVLMTGLHHGHTRVRGNAAPEGSGPQRLRATDFTVARALQLAGYRTGLIGKWGLGMAGDAGAPNKQGFDYFFGYLSQHHAHNHYPDYLWRNEAKVPLPNGVLLVGTNGGGYATNAVVYAGDLFTEEALRFIERPSDELRAAPQPWFLYLAYVAPHANNERTRQLKEGAEVPDLGIYRDAPWPPANRAHAAMITRMDADIGRLLRRLRELGIEQNTLVMFSSDNGPHKESGHDPALFRPAEVFRGYKRDLTEGGIRVPFLAWWPGTIRPGSVSTHVGYFGDFFATAVELASGPLPKGLDSLSLVPVLRGRRGARSHEWLYWEFHEGGFSQAALQNGRWKGIRSRRVDAPLELYDLKTDPGETHNLAATHPRRVAAITRYLATARTESSDWPIHLPRAAHEQP